jgi:prophage antirepressor-like protein
MQMDNGIVKMESGFAFEGHPVRVELFDGEPWWAARDVALALGYSENSNMTMLCDKVPDEWRSVKPFDTLGGTQEIIALSEQGLYFFLARSNMPAALPFQKWIAGEVLPSIRRTGSYGLPAKPLSATEMFILQAHAFAEQEQRRAALEAGQEALKEAAREAARALARTDARVDKLDERAREAGQALKGIEAPDAEAREVTTRMMITRIVRAYCIANHIDYAEGYQALYREFRDRYGINIPVRARNKGVSAIDLAERDGYLEALHAVAYRIFVEQPELDRSADEDCRTDA